MNADTFCWFIHVDICTLYLGITVSLTPLRLLHSVGNLMIPNCRYIISAYCRSSLYSIFGNNELTALSLLKGSLLVPPISALPQVQTFYPLVLDQLIGWLSAVFASAFAFSGRGGDTLLKLFSSQRIISRGKYYLVLVMVSWFIVHWNNGIITTFGWIKDASK